MYVYRRENKTRSSDDFDCWRVLYFSNSDRVTRRRWSYFYNTPTLYLYMCVCVCVYKLKAYLLVYNALYVYNMFLCTPRTTCSTEDKTSSSTPQPTPSKFFRFYYYSCTRTALSCSPAPSYWHVFQRLFSYFNRSSAPL